LWCGFVPGGCFPCPLFLFFLGGFLNMCRWGLVGVLWCHHHQTNPHQKADANDSGTEVSTALGLPLENSRDLPLHHEWTKPPVVLLLRFPEVGIISVGVLDLF